MFLMLVLPIEFRFTMKFDLIYIFCKISFSLTFLTPFFLYILIGKIYREQFILLFKKIFRIGQNLQIGRIDRRNTVVPINTQLPIQFY
jgi:hypothetical protein